MSETIWINGTEYTVKRNSRRKNIAVMADACGEISIALPMRYKISAKTESIIALLLEKILKRTAKVPTAKSYTEHETFFFRGIEYPLRFTESTTTIEFRDNAFWLNPKRISEAKRLFEQLYKRSLEKRLSLCLPQLCKLLNVKPLRITIKTTSSVWGSCSKNGNLSFCTRLALLPDNLFEYIVVHELCHLIQLNHSEKFWFEVEKIIPDYKERRAILNKNGYIYKWW